MSALIPFTPSNLAAPSFVATLDGAARTIVMTWNVAAQRYYLNVYDNDGTWIITTPLVTSPTGEIVTAMSYDPARRVMNVTKATGWWHKPGTMVDYTFLGFDPASLNGLQRCLHVDTVNFSFPLAQDPGVIVTLGSANRLLNMVATVFQQSSLIYRNGCFEVNP
jgi:hypothetical protein